jgi:hypothetical protein
MIEMPVTTCNWHLNILENLNLQVGVQCQLCYCHAVRVIPLIISEASVVFVSSYKCLNYTIEVCNVEFASVKLSGSKDKLSPESWNEGMWEHDGKYSLH